MRAPPSGGQRPAESAAFGSELRRLRLRAGLTREVLAERAGVSLATLSVLETGQRRRPYPNTVVALAEALGLASDDRARLLELASGAAAPPVDREPAPTPPPVPATTDAGPRVRLPMPPTALIGREQEITAATILLDSARSAVRLLTLTGPGGVGKTRLALAVAAALADAYADGVVFVDLAALRDERLVPATIARALDLREAGARSARDLLLEYLRERQVLLVLDNFEHLLDAAPLLAQLLESCPRLALLVTSRAALRLRSEQRFPVPPLVAPAEQWASAGLPESEVTASAPAVRLFVERAQAAAPDFVLGAGAAPAVAAICRRLDGMPLAIELAAARAGLLRPEALLRRLEQRLPLLTGGAPDLPERQQTLRQTLAWSHDLLGPAEQVLFRRLAVFAGGWTLEAAEAVCADATVPAPQVLDGLTALVDQSLLPPVRQVAGEARFDMLETVREYARERWEDEEDWEALARAHASYYLTLAEQAEALAGADQATWLARLAREQDNLRAALSWWLAHEPERGLGLAGTLGWFWRFHGDFGEGRTWVSRLLQTSAAHTPSAGKALAVAAILAWQQRDNAAARALALEGVALCRHLGEQRGLVEVLREAARAAYQAGDLPSAEQAGAESLALARALGDRSLVGQTLDVLGSVARYADDYARAAALFEEALAHFRELGDTTRTAVILCNLGYVAQHEGEAVHAVAYYAESLALLQSIGHGFMAVRCIGGLAGVAAGAGDSRRAARLFGAAAALADALGTPLGAADRALLDRRLAAVRSALGDDAFRAAWDAGQALTRAQALADALQRDAASS